MRLFLRMYFSHCLIMLLNYLASLENRIFLCMILMISVLFFPTHKK